MIVTETGELKEPAKITYSLDGYTSPIGYIEQQNYPNLNMISFFGWLNTRPVRTDEYTVAIFKIKWK